MPYHIVRYAWAFQLKEEASKGNERMKLRHLLIDDAAASKKCEQCRWINYANLIGLKREESDWINYELLRN